MMSLQYISMGEKEFLDSETILTLHIDDEIWPFYVIFGDFRRFRNDTFSYKPLYYWTQN